MAASLIAVPAAMARGTFTLTVSSVGKGGGSVTSDIGGLDCDAQCQASFDNGETVTLTADGEQHLDLRGVEGRLLGDRDLSGHDGRRPLGAGRVRPGLPPGRVDQALWPEHRVHDRSPASPLAREQRLQHERRKKQTVSVRLEDGEGVRFWLILENDGVGRSDVIHVQGCRRDAQVRRQRGARRVPEAPRLGADNLHHRVQERILSFPFPAVQAEQAGQAHGQHRRADHR